MLRCATLCYVVLCYIILYRIIPYYNMLYYIKPYYILLYRILFYFSSRWARRSSRRTAAPASERGQTGSALMGSLRILVFLTGTLWVLPLTYFCHPKSARAYLFPQSVKIHQFCSGPISVDPICPQPNDGSSCRVAHAASSLSTAASVSSASGHAIGCFSTQPQHQLASRHKRRPGVETFRRAKRHRTKEQTIK